MRIPKIIHQVWIGPLPRPTKWMRTWPALNPDWKYRIWGNRELKSRKWENQAIIDEYLERCRDVRRTGTFTSAQGNTFAGEKATLFAWHVIADVMRYEILMEHGGFMPGADTECLRPIPDDAFGEAEIYAVRTGNRYVAKFAEMREKLCNGGFTKRGEPVKFRRYDEMCAAPVMACVKGHPFLRVLIDEIKAKQLRGEVGEAVDTTGNVLMGEMMRRHSDKLTGLVMPNYLNEKESQEADAWRVHHAGTTFNRYRFAR